MPTYRIYGNIGDDEVARLVSFFKRKHITYVIHDLSDVNLEFIYNAGAEYLPIVLYKENELIFGIQEAIKHAERRLR